MQKTGRYIQAGLLLACLLLIANCGGQSFVYQPAKDHPPGPGLFSGEDGEFKLISTGSEDEDYPVSQEEKGEDEENTH